MKEYVVGLDVGTLETKVIVFNREGEALGEGARELGMSFPREGWFEQDLEEIWIKTASAIHDSIAAAKISSEEIACISVTGQRETVCPVDREGKPLRPAMSWQDTRGWEVCKTIRRTVGAETVYRITGLPVNTMPPASKILWTKRNEPEIYRKAWKFIGVVDFTVWKLSNELVTDYSNANRTMLFDIRKLDWSNELLREFRLDREKMLDLVKPGTPVGTVTEESCKKTGLDRHVSVIYAGGDQQCSALGIGIVKPRRVSCILGTCTNIEAFSERIPFDPKMSLQAQVHVMPHAYLSEGGIGTSGIIYRWFRDQFGQTESQVAKELNEDPYKILDQEAANVEPGSNGLMLIPYFAGSLFPYWNAEDRGVLIGLRLDHTKKHFIRAILEGVAYEYRRMAEEAERVSKTEIDTVRFMGGGARSPLWTQIFIDVLGVKGEIPEVTEAGAFGAYMLGAVAVGRYRTVLEAAEKSVKLGRKMDHNSNAHERYSKFYGVHRQVYDRIQSLVNEISRIGVLSSR